MDIWRYFDVTHADHDVMNPSTPERIDKLAPAIGVEEGTRVLDVGCGMAALPLPTSS